MKGVQDVQCPFMTFYRNSGRGFSYSFFFLFPFEVLRLLFNGVERSGWPGGLRYLHSEAKLGVSLLYIGVYLGAESNI